MKPIYVTDIISSLTNLNILYKDLTNIVQHYHNNKTYEYYIFDELKYLIDIQNGNNTIEYKKECCMFIHDIKFYINTFRKNTNMSDQHLNQYNQYNQLTTDILNMLESAYQQAVNKFKQTKQQLTVRLDGDIVITDPCYFDDKWYREHYLDTIDYDDNHLVKNNLFGFKHPHIHSETLYGDWGCTVWNTNTKEQIGSFCADAGLVIVCHLDDVKNIVSNVEQWIEQYQGCATIIRDFHGDVSIVWEPDQFVDPNNGKVEYYLECKVVGIGNINFIGEQTSM